MHIGHACNMSSCLPVSGACHATLWLCYISALCQFGLVSIQPCDTLALHQFSIVSTKPYDVLALYQLDIVSAWACDM